MRFNREANALRSLAEALENEAKVLGWLDEYGAQVLGSLEVKWPPASSCVGYKETRELVTAVVQEFVPQILSKVRSRASLEVELRRAQLADVTNKGEDEGEEA